MPTNIGTAFFNVTFNTAAARRELTALVSTANRSFGLLGGISLVAATAGVVGLTRATFEVGQTALTAANEYEQAFANVRKTLDEGELSAVQAEIVFERLSDQLRELALRTPLDLEDDITQVAALGAQLGIATEDLLDFTEVITEVGVTTNIAVEDAATGFARLANIMGVSSDEFRALGDSLINLGNNLPAQEDEILRFSLRTAAAGEIIGFTADEVLALSGAMASVGVPAERGGTAMQRTMIKIEQAVSQGTDSVALFSEVAGLSAQQFIDLWQTDASEAFTLFVEGLGRAGGQAFGILQQLELGEQRTLQALLSIANAGPLLRDSFLLGSEAAGALARESGIFFDTTQARIELLKNTVHDAGITIGDAVQGPFNELISGITDWIKANPQLIEQIGTNLAGALEAVTPLALSLVDGIVKLTEAWSNFIAGLVGSDTDIVSLGAAEEFADFLERGLSFDPSLAGIAKFFGVAGGVEFLTLAEARLVEQLQAGAPVVKSMADAIVELNDSMVGTGESISQWGIEEILDTAKLTEDQMIAVVEQARAMGVAIPPAIDEMLGLRNVTDSWMNLLAGQEGPTIPDAILGEIDLESQLLQAEAAAEKAAALADAVGTIRAGFTDMEISSSDFLDNINLLNPEMAEFLRQLGGGEMVRGAQAIGRARIETALMEDAVNNLRISMEKPASAGIFGVGDIIDGIKQVTRTVGESNEEVALHASDMVETVLENLNTIAEFEANLITLFAQGFEEVARFLAEQGPEFAHIAEDFVDGLADPQVLNDALEHGGALSEETEQGMKDALAAAEMTPELLDFIAQMGSTAVLSAAYLEGQADGNAFGKGWYDGVLPWFARIAALVPGFTLPTSPAGSPAGETDIPTQNGGGGGGGGTRVMNLNFTSSGTTSGDAARAAQLLNALVLE